MLFGSKQSSPQEPQGNEEAQTVSGAVIFDANASNFEDLVMRASMEKPLIVDFWAPWCGPCKQLMPLLESEVNAAGGEVLLAKVNLDENPELAQALRVQSVPAVFAFLGGRPVDAFQGMVPQSQIKAFIDKLVQAARAAKPGAIDADEFLGMAGEALAAGDLTTANSLYVQILQQDDKNAKAYAGLIRVFIGAGQIEQAESLIANATDEIAKDSNFQEAKTALEFAKNAPAAGELENLVKAAENAPEDHQAKVDLAEAQFASGFKEDAIDTLIASIKVDREWNESLARTTLLKFFEAMGHTDPLTIQGRKKLSSILFS